MICVTVFYANTPGKKFDHDYYQQKHVPLAKERLATAGMLRCEVDRGLSGALPGSPAPSVCVCRFYFSSVDEFGKAFQAHAPELLADLPKFTDIQPDFQVSQTT